MAQEIVLTEPKLVPTLILTGTGPAGGEVIDKVTPLTIVDMIKGALTFRDPKYYLFFTTTQNGRRAAKAFLERLKEGRTNRDKAIFPRRFLGATQGDQGLWAASAARPERHPHSHLRCEWRSGQDGAEQQYPRSRPAYPRRATGDLRGTPGMAGSSRITPISSRKSCPSSRLDAFPTGRLCGRKRSAFRPGTPTDTLHSDFLSSDRIPTNLQRGIHRVIRTVSEIDGRRGLQPQGIGRER